MKLREQKRRRKLRGQGARARDWARYIRHYARHLKPGTIIETCGCDVARVTMIDGDDLEYESLTRGGRGSCSVYNCGPIPLRPVAIERRLQLFKEGGMQALTMRYYREDCQMTEQQAMEMIEQWK